MFGRKQETNGSNGAAKESPPILLHFDVNKTVIQSDSIQLKSIEDGIREGIAELFWGTTKKQGDKVTWEWTGAKPSCAPPSDDIRNVGTALQNYAQYCKEAVPDKKLRKDAIKSFSLISGLPVQKEMEKLLQLTMKKMQLQPEVRYKEETLAAGVQGSTYNMFPSLFHLVASLQRANRTFAILFRSFGADHLKIKTEWNAFCELKHPIFSRLIEDIGAMDGSVPGIPDRRIHHLHTLYRDSAGPVLLLETFTNGPDDASWDAWARAKPEPKADTRNGRQYISQTLRCKTVEGIPKMQQWMSKHLLAQQTGAIKDDWAWWQFKGECAEAGKLLTLIPGKKGTQQLFFDDNIDHNNCRIVDCRDEKGASIAHTKALSKLCVKVNPVEAILDNDYFYRKLLHAQGDSLDVGASMMGLQKQLTEVEEEKASMAKQLNNLNVQLKMLMDENRRMKLQRRINVRDEGELYTLLSKHKVDLNEFDKNGHRSLSELYFEVEHGHCWVEVNEQDEIVRVMDMVFMKLQFKDLILIETHEQDSQQRVYTRNFLPGIITNAKESNVQKELDKFFESGLGVNLSRCVEVDAHPVYVPDAPNQQTGASKWYPIKCQIQQNQGMYSIPEKEVDLNKEVLAKIGLPAGKHFTTQEKDLHGGSITRFWRWDKKATWEASAGLTSKEGRPPLDVAATCEKVFKGHPRIEEYKKLLLQMFEIFEAQLLTGGFSGSLVLRVQPFEADGRPGEPCIVKLDNGAAIREEYVNSVNVFKALPDRAARILGEPAYEKNNSGEEFGAMRLELAGACWNVPELAQGSASLLSTFKDLLLYESEQVMLSGSLAISDETRPFGNVNSILAETFGPGGVVSSLRKGGNGLRRADPKMPLTGMKWYTLKGKEGKFNLFTADKKQYPPGEAMRRMYKDFFKGDMPKLKDLVQGNIKPSLEKLEKSSGLELCPLVGLAHGDLNAANIMIDALEAVWVIDFATSVELPLFTDMCKFEMACLFEYAVIPITPKLLVEFTSNSEELWEQMNVRDWQGTDPAVASYLLQKFHNLPPERLNVLSQNELEKLIEEAVTKAKPSKQRKYERSLKARLTADEAVMAAAFQYCSSISDTLLQGDTLGDTLEIKGIPLPEGRGARGSLSLRFFMDICVSVRRFMAQDMMGCLREQKQSGKLMPVDWLSLQMWLPFLRESFRIVGYRDIAPQYKIWSIYHCHKVYQNVSRILETIQQNIGKLEQSHIMTALQRDLDMGKSTMRRERSNGATIEKSDLDKLQAMSNWVHSYAARFPSNPTCTNIVRKVHQQDPLYDVHPGFYCPVWQVTMSEETRSVSNRGTGSVNVDEVVKLDFNSGEGTARPTSRTDVWDIVVNVPCFEGGSMPQRIQLGSMQPGKSGLDAVVTLKSRLLPMTVDLLKLADNDGSSQGAVGQVLSDRFSLGGWTEGVRGLENLADLTSGMGHRKSGGAAPAPRLKKQGSKMLRTESDKEHSNKELLRFLKLEAHALDTTERKRASLLIVLGVPVYCYPPGTNICIDSSADGFDQLRSSKLVVYSQAENGSYVVRSATDPTLDSETCWDPTPMNHTFLLQSRYEVGHSVLVNKSTSDGGWVKATISEKAGPATDWLYKIDLQLEDGKKHVEPRHLDPMNSGRITSGVSAEMFEEESQKIKQYLRVRSSFIIDSLSGSRLNVKECAPPTLKTKGVFFGMTMNDKRSKGSLRQLSLGVTSSQSEDGEGGSQKGWASILNKIENYEKGVPSCSPNAFLVLGSPGSGKTCMVSRLIMEIVDRYTNIMPLLLSVADLVKRSAPDSELAKLDPGVIGEWFDKYLRITFGEDSSRYLMICQAIKMNRVMFIFEGLEDSGELKDVIECFIRLRILDRHLVIITSRPLIGGQSTLEDISESIVAMKLDNLSDEQIRMVAHARLGLPGIDAFDSLFTKLKSSQKSMDAEDDMNMAQGESGESKEEEVFGNPMMLSMLLCYLQTMMKKEAEKEAEKREAVQRGEYVDDHNEGGEEQDEATITSVYRVAIDVMLQRVQSKQQADRHNKEEKMDAYKRILEIMALHMTLHMHSERGDAIMANDVDQLLPTRQLQQSWPPLKAAVIAGHAMFLRAQGESGKEELRFLVKDFQNFFSASAVAHNAHHQMGSASVPDLPELITDPGWAKVLEMLAEAWPRDYVTLIEKRLEKFTGADGDTFLHIAARAGHRPVFQLLKHFNERNREALKKKSKEQLTPLHVAAEKGYTHLCLLMLDAGAPIDALDSTDRLPMHAAMQRGNFTTAKVLMQKWTDQMSTDYQLKVKKSKGQAEALAVKVMNKISEDDFKKTLDETFAELHYFGEKFNVDRKKTLGSLLAVFWICGDHYEWFTRSQKEADKLSKISWQTLQDWVNKNGITKNNKALGAMMVYVTIQNLSKIRPFMQAFAPEFDAPAEAVAAILQRNPILVPSYLKLDDNLQSTILSAVKADFNLGQFLQAENFPYNLIVVKQATGQQAGGAGNVDVLGFLFFRILVMMCGIVGAKSLDGSLFMIEKQYQNYKLGLDVLEKLRSESVQQVYDRFLQERARPQELPFNVSDPNKRALVRLACLTRVFDSKSAKEVADAWNELDPQSRQALTNFINRDGVDTKPAFLLWNSPNLMANSRSNQHVGLREAMKMLLTIYQAAEKEYSGTDKAVVTIVVDEMADLTQSVQDTESYQNTNFEITRAAGLKSDNQGTVHRSPWQPLNDQGQLDSYNDQAMELVYETSHASVREPAFLKKLGSIYPELKYLTASDDPQSKRYHRETILALLTIYWTVSGQESLFNRSQQEKKLTEGSWKGIQQFMEKASLKKNQEAVNAIFAAMVIHALGKLGKFKDQMAPQSSDHRQAMSVVFDKAPKVLPSYWRLSPQYRQLVQECLTRPFNFSQFLDAELVPASLTVLKDMLLKDRGGDLSKSNYLHLYMYTVFAELSATSGETSLEGSLYMTEERWQEFQIGLRALQGLEKESETVIYERFLEARSHQLGLPCSPDDAASQAVVRIACLCTVSIDDAPKVKDAFDAMDSEERQSLVRHMTADGISQKPGFVLRDARAYLQNALANTQVGLTPALRILNKVYQQVAKDFAKSSKPVVTINLERLAVFAKSFTGSVTFQDLPFEMRNNLEENVMVIPKVWIPVKNPSVLTALKRKGQELAGDLLNGKIHSEKIFKTKIDSAFPELSYFKETYTEKKDQTICAMLSVFWLVRDMYDSFIRSQAEDVQLSRQSWAWIQDWMKDDVKLVTEESIDAILTFMAIHALGKINEFREELAQGFDAQAHDSALASILDSQPEVVPSYQRLPDKYKGLIKDALSVDFQFNQFVQAENVAANLVVVKDKLKPHGDDGFAFFCFRIFVQICGKLGPRGMQGSMFMTEQQFQRFRPGLDALQQLRTREAATAYNAFLLLQGAKALSRFASPEHKALSRLLCLGSASDLQAGNAFCEAFDQLAPSERDKLIRLLTADGVTERPGYVLCEAPDLLKAAQQNPKVGLTGALRMMVKTQERCTADKSFFKVYVHLNELAEWAKDAESIQEFGQARLDFRNEDDFDNTDDQTKTRIYRIQVSRPHYAKGANANGSRHKDFFQRCASCCQYSAFPISIVCLLLALGTAIAALAAPDALAPALPTSPSTVAYVLLVVSALVLLCICCTFAQRRGMRYKFGGSRALCCDYSSRPESRPLICCYTLLESRDESIV